MSSNAGTPAGSPNTRGPITPCQNTSAVRGAAVGHTEAPEQAGGCEPQCIAPPRLDGHTRLRWEFVGIADGELARLVTELREPRTREQARRERRAGPMTRRLPSGEWCEVTVSGVRRQMLTFHIHDVIHATVNVDEGELRLQFKAHALWSTSDQREHVLAWVRAWTSMVGGDTEARPFDIGWCVTGIELCADFVGLRWTPADAASFVGRYKRETIRAYLDAADRVETINVGSRASNVSWCLYDKTRQIASAKDGRNLPTYASTWESFGWDGEAEVSRVELRLTARGLTYTDGETELDLRDPEALTVENLHRAWAHACSKYRMTVPTATRRERCDTDPRWLSVAQCIADRPAKLRQSRRVAEDAHAERVRRSSRAVALGVRRLAALHGCAIVGHQGFASVAAVAETIAASEVDASAYGEAYTRLQTPALGAAVDEARERLMTRLQGDCSGLEDA